MSGGVGSDSRRASVTRCLVERLIDVFTVFLRKSEINKRNHN
jgi:hypothetical protein